MDPTLKVAKKYAGVHFEHATGYKRDRNMSNYSPLLRRSLRPGREGLWIVVTPLVVNELETSFHPTSSRRLGRRSPSHLAKSDRLATHAATLVELLRGATVSFMSLVRAGETVCTAGTGAAAVLKVCLRRCEAAKARGRAHPSPIEMASRPFNCMHIVCKNGQLPILISLYRADFASSF
jgi:hypothetical protein